MEKRWINIIEDLIRYYTKPDPPPNIANATVHFADIVQQNHCDPRATGLTPCIRKCEHACQVTFQFDDPKCSEGYSSAIWSDTCYKNFRNGKFRRKFATKGCTDYEIWWGTHPMPHGSGWARDITIEKKAKNEKKKNMAQGEGDRCWFQVTNCHRSIAKLESGGKSCMVSGGSCSGRKLNCCQDETRLGCHIH